MDTINVTWSGASTLSATGVHHGYRTAPGSVDDWLSHAGSETFKDGVGLGLGKVRKVWWGMLEPGGFILPHIDAGPYFERWHYPIEPAGYVYQRSEIFEAPTEPFAIEHYQAHAVWNPTDKRRVHLIVELDNRVAEGTAKTCPLVVFDPLPEMRGLVDAVT